MFSIHPSIFSFSVTTSSCAQCCRGSAGQHNFLSFFFFSFSPFFSFNKMLLNFCRFCLFCAALCRKRPKNRRFGFPDAASLANHSSCADTFGHDSCIQVSRMTFSAATYCVKLNTSRHLGSLTLFLLPSSSNDRLVTSVPLHFSLACCMSSFLHAAFDCVCVRFVSEGICVKKGR